GRAAAVAGELVGTGRPPCLASLLVAEEFPEDEGEQRRFLAAAFAALRPYGGAMLLPLEGERAAAVASLAGDLGLAGARVGSAGGRVTVRRGGALPGAGNWAHEHAAAANSPGSPGERANAALGPPLLGGPAHAGILPRHGHGPQPQVVDGRAVIEGMDLLRAVDVYTGRLLWETRLPGVGKAFDNLRHQPGANASGSNYVSLPDGIYVA